MGFWFSKFKPQELIEFRQLHSDVEDVDIPTLPKNRKFTDKRGSLISGLVFCIFLSFFIYALVNSDIRRLVRPYDNCGNFCGLRNEKIPGINCSGMDYTTKPYGMCGLFSSKCNETNKSIEDRKCFANCPENYKRDSHFCEKSASKRNNFIDFRNSIFDFTNDSSVHNDNVSNEFNLIQNTNDLGDHPRLNDDAGDKFFLMNLMYLPLNWVELMFSFMLTITLCVVVLVLLKFAPAVVIWGVFTLIILLLVTVSGISWSAYASSATKDKFFLAWCIVCTIITLCVILLFIFLYKRMRLEILLYKEATQAVFRMPSLFLFSLLIIFFQLATIISFVVSIVWMMTSVSLIKISENTYDYDYSGIIIFSMVFDFVVTFWALQFIKGLKHTVVSGSVASWYFAEDKRFVEAPVFTNIFITFRYHIGTVVFGSFLITSVYALKIIMKLISFNKKCKDLLHYSCLGNLELFLKALSKVAFVVTALHGQSFFKSGRRATELIINNATKFFMLNCVGDFIVVMTETILIIVSTGIIQIVFLDLTNPLSCISGIICLILNSFIIVTTFGVLEATIETLFICFCEDKIINDGVSKPYYMSKGLIEYLENSKDHYEDRNIIT